MNRRTKRRSFLKKVNEEFLHKMSNDQCNRFTDNIGGVIQVIDYVESNQFENGLMFINNAFEWGETPEGHDYWSNVANILRKVTVNYNEDITIDLDIVDKLKQQIKNISEENQSLKIQLDLANLKLESQPKPYVDDWSSVYLKMKNSRTFKNRLIPIIDGFNWLQTYYYPPVSKGNDEDY